MVKSAAEREQIIIGVFGENPPTPVETDDLEMDDVFEENGDGEEDADGTRVQEEEDDVTNVFEDDVHEDEHSDDMHEDDVHADEVGDDVHGDDQGVFAEFGPQVGMVFKTRDDLVQVYKAFGKMKGFCASIRNSRSNYVLIRCDRGRTNLRAKKRTKRVGCDAMICASKDKEDYWTVTTVNVAHNHEMDPDMSKFMSGHRTITYAQKRHLENVDISGVPVCKNIRWLQFQSGGPGNISCSDRDCRTFIDQMRRLRLGKGDAAAIHSLFNRLQKKDPSFYHMMDIGDDMALRNVMWIHPRSKAAYEDFHDVVSFDTTYLVNRYCMPFATMVGINHHHQSVLLGCALLGDEQSASFKWFFSNWLEAMGGVAPTAILTDQCESIKNALREVMLDTIHRFCIWHILYKLPEKFKLLEEYTKAIADFKNMVYDSLSIREFEGRWAEFLVEFGLENNNWLRELYVVRESWVPIYLNQFFWAGMRSTQRSESMHAFFDGYINSKSTLKAFVEQYEIAITNKTHKELEADYKSKCTNLTRRTRFDWEDQFGRVYTNNVFELFQKEIEKMVCCNLSVVDRSLGDVLGGIERYDVKELGIIGNWYHKEYVYRVKYRSNGAYFACECKKFESKGILCCHILKVLIHKDIRFVNDRYILRRWMKDVYRPHTKLQFSGGYPHLTKEYTLYRKLEDKFEKCKEIIHDKPPRMALFDKRLDELIVELSDMAGGSVEHGSSANDDGEPSTEFHVLDPHITKSRGQPKENRMKSVAEKNRGRGRCGRGVVHDTNVGTQERAAS